MCFIVVKVVWNGRILTLTHKFFPMVSPFILIVLQLRPYISPEALIRLLVYLVGVGSTVVGSWIASKIHTYHESRAAHLKDLKERLLIPLLQGLNNSLRALVNNTTLPVSEVSGLQGLRPNAKVTELANIYGASLRAVSPFEKIEGALDQALHEDVRKHHFPELIASWLEFERSWNQYARTCENWVSQMARRILQSSNLPSPDGDFQKPYIMQNLLALFGLMRLFQIPTDQLRKVPHGQYWAIAYVGEVAMGTEEQIDALLAELEELIDRREIQRAAQLREELDRIRAHFQGLVREITFAIASQHLRARCPLVSFW